MEIQKEPGLPPTTNLGPEVLPYTLDIISDILAKFIPPEGEFDPNGDWDHCYAMWTATRGYFGETTRTGSLRVRRKANASGAELAITQVTEIMGKRRSVSEVQAQCAVDKLATPEKWETKTSLHQPNGKTIGYTESLVKGEVSGSEIALSGSTSVKLKVAEAFTGSWMLFDAVQRLPFDIDPLAFDMLEELELHKPGQKLAPGPTVEVTINERKLRLHSFSQMGEGILPIAYWLDDQHRLLAVVGGLRALVWDPTADIAEEQV